MIGFHFWLAWAGLFRSGPSDLASVARCVSKGPVLQFLHLQVWEQDIEERFWERQGAGEVVSKAFVGPAGSVRNLMNCLKWCCNMALKWKICGFAVRCAFAVPSYRCSSSLPAAWERRSSMLEELLLLQLHCGQCTINITHWLCPGLCLLQSKLPRMCRKSVRFGINAADNCERGRESHSPVQVSGPGSLHNALMPLKNKLLFYYYYFPSSKVFLLWRCFKLPFSTVSYQYLYWCLASQSSQTSSDLLNTLSSRKWIDDGLRMHYCSSSSCCITCAVIAAMMNTVQP